MKRNAVAAGAGARELECDEDEAAFEDAVKRIAVAPPEPEDKA